MPTDHKASLGRIDCYEILKTIGLGGSSIVFEALDTRLERIVAIKVLMKRDGLDVKSRDRFKRGVLAAAGVAHPHVVSILAMGEQKTAPYVVSEFVRGRTLARAIQLDGALPVEMIIRVTHQILLGLCEIHDKDLVHRDIKPDNIILRHPDELVKIADFGIAKTSEESGLTRTGEVNGTPEFMSPEQAEGRKSLDRRSDLFNLGAVIYAMAAGHSPFKAPTQLASMRSVCDDTPQPIQELNSEVPDWLANSIAWLLEKDPDDRPQHAHEIVHWFEDHGTAIPSRDYSTALSRVRRFGSPRRMLYLIFMIAFCISELFATNIVATSYEKSHDFLVLYIKRHGILDVQVDDPAVVFEVNFMFSGRADRSKSQPQFHQVGSFRRRLPPDLFFVQGFKDGELVYSNEVHIKPSQVHLLKVNTSEDHLASNERERGSDSKLEDQSLMR